MEGLGLSQDDGEEARGGAVQGGECGDLQGSLSSFLSFFLSSFCFCFFF